jgi:hypothetical protein
LAALSGIATRVNKMRTWTYLAGVRKEGLPWHLLWMVDVRLANSVIGVTVKRIGQAPSWSCASMDSKVLFFFCGNRTVMVDVKILAAEVTLVDKHEFGRVSSGSIRLRVFFSCINKCMQSKTMTLF